MTFPILSSVHRAVRQITLTLEAGSAQADLGLSATEGHALCYIAAYGPCPTSNVQRVLGAQRSTITSLLDRLVGRRLVERRGDSDDKRVLLVAVTPAGAQLAEAMGVHGRALEQAIRERVDDQDLQAFDRVIDAIAAATGITVVDHSQHRKSAP